jgi:hypothetical protein
MRANLIFLALSASVVFGQAQADANVAEVFHVHHIANKLDLSEFATIIRVVTDRSEVKEDAAQMTLSVKGTPVQIAIADWLITELDQQTLPQFSTKEFKIPNKEDDVARVFFLPHPAAIQDFQEIATAIRTTVETRWVFTFNSPRALVVRGTADQLAAAEFLIRELDQPADAKRTDSRQYQMIDVSKYPATEVRVFYLPYATTVQQFQKVATAVRIVLEIRRTFTYNSPRALVIRGNAEEVAAAGWLVHELGKPVSPGTVASEAYHTVDLNREGEDIVRVFYANDVTTVTGLEQVADQIKTATMMRRVFAYAEMKAIVVRGTAGRVAMAEQIVNDRQIAAK